MLQPCVHLRFATSCPLLQHSPSAIATSCIIPPAIATLLMCVHLLLQHPVRHCNSPSAIATQPVHSTRFVTTLLEPACHMTNPSATCIRLATRLVATLPTSACILQHLSHCNISVSPLQHCHLATLKCNHYIVVGKSTSMRCMRNPYVNSL
ncbi:hypothetical protein SCLCIDRAFT_759310 [Scleroderma citrinum Foug A]|uniref:Uncharacterized protein n=1 Tax=Scleroderma citrinum Foug A TaxID=1036808 RepID=A0A0C3CQB9_9AGAM|nr:hypothetical protein SCLCIDRAFT_759310 [Scleroderma citrinum Foug A]